TILRTRKQVCSGNFGKPAVLWLFRHQQIYTGPHGEDFNNMSKRAPLALVLFVVVSSTVLVAQSTQGAKPAAQGDKGFTSYAEFGGTSNVDGQVYRLESSVGYNFNQHFGVRSEEHTSELQSRENLVCRLLL